MKESLSYQNLTVLMTRKTELAPKIVLHIEVLWKSRVAPRGPRSKNGGGAEREIAHPGQGWIEGAAGQRRHTTLLLEITMYLRPWPHYYQTQFFSEAPNHVGSLDINKIRNNNLHNLDGFHFHWQSIRFYPPILYQFPHSFWDQLLFWTQLEVQFLLSQDWVVEF